MVLKQLIFCFLLLSFGKSTNDETIAWNSSRKLTWNDFKANPNNESDAVALTASGISFGYSVKTSDKKIVEVSTEVKAIFYPNKSWYFKGKSDKQILKHEQLHFDITELYARKFRAQLSKLSMHRHVKKEMDNMHVTINKALNDTQKRYDKETNHSLNKEQQKQWEAIIAKALAELEVYKS